MKNIIKTIVMAIFGIMLFNMPSQASAAATGCTVGCGITTVNVGSNLVKTGTSGTPVIDLSSNPTIPGTYTAKSFVSTGTDGTTQGLDGTIIHSTGPVTIPAVGQTVTFAIAHPPTGIIQLLNDIAGSGFGSTSGGPIKAYLVSNSNQGCGCNATGIITSWDGTSVTFQTTATQNPGRGTSISYFELLGPVNAIGGGKAKIAIGLGYISGALSTSNVYPSQQVVGYTNGELTELRATSSTADNGTSVFSVLLNGTSIGTMSFANGATTANTVLSSPVPINSDDILTVQCTTAGTATGVDVIGEGDQSTF